MKKSYSPFIFLAACGLTSLNAQTSTFYFTAEVDSYTSFSEQWDEYPTSFVTTPRGSAENVSGSIRIDYATPDYAPFDPSQGRYVSGLYRTPAYTEPGNPETNLTDFAFSLHNDSGDVFSDAFAPKATLTESNEIVFYSPSAIVYDNTKETLNIAGFDIPVGSDVIHLTSWQQISSTRGYLNREIHLLLVDQGGNALSDDLLPETFNLEDFDAANLVYEDKGHTGAGTFAYYNEERSLTATLTQFSTIPEPSSALLLALTLPALLIRRR
ncbi:hypothetical protein [Roseibacillus persicicus]|nr:hypothetical protein [Roseibacillus persicicus]